MEALAQKVAAQFHSKELPRRIDDGLPVTARVKAAIEWIQKYQRLGDAVEESFRIRGWRVASREFGLIHAEKENDPGVCIFIYETGYEQWLKDFPPVKKSTWELYFEQWHWADPIWGPLPSYFDLPQSDEESEMPLNQQDFDNIAAAVKKSVVATSWKQTLTLCATIAVFSIGCVTWWTTRLDRVDDKLDARITTLGQKLDAHFGNIEQTLGKQGEVLARLDERTQVLTSSGNGLSKRPTTKGGSPTP